MTKKIVFLCSGGGGNLAFVHRLISIGALGDTEIVGVLVDRSCAASRFADAAGLYNRQIDVNGAGERSLIDELDRLDPDIIITTIHRILGGDIVGRYFGKLINLHYSLLPAFPGLIGAKPVEAALAGRVLFAGVTVHRLVEEVDAGRPIVQGVIPLKGAETVDNFMPVVFRSGCIALSMAIRWLLRGESSSNTPVNVDVFGYRCIFNGGLHDSGGFVTDEDFWLMLRKCLE